MKAILTVTVKRVKHLDDWAAEDDVLMVEGTSEVDLLDLRHKPVLDGLVTVTRDD